MHVASVPCTRATVYITVGWRHKRKWKREALGFERVISDEAGITLGALIDVWEQHQPVRCRMDLASHVGSGSHMRAVPADILRELREEHPGTFSLNVKRSIMSLDNMVFPTEAQRQGVCDYTEEVANIDDTV